jgi:hypothetical protein
VEVATFPIYYPTMAFVNLCRYAKKKLNGKWTVKYVHLSTNST